MPVPNSETTTWPTAWTLKPTDGQPNYSADGGEAIGWDLSFGFRLNVDHDDYEDDSSPLTIGAHFSDADLARGFVKREVTPDQLEEFARLLLELAANHKRRLTTRPYVEGEWNDRNCDGCGTPVAATSKTARVLCVKCHPGDLPLGPPPTATAPSLSPEAGDAR